MNSLGKKISISRKEKKLSQEVLADLAKVNLRTIQRIENNENIPRPITLKLICDVLDLDQEEINNSPHKIKVNYGEVVVHYFFLLIINLVLTAIIAFMTMDSEANLNSRFAGFLLAFFIPIFIVMKTQNLSKVERFLKFGSGFLFNIFLSIIVVGFPIAFVSGLLVFNSISLLTLYYGDFFCDKK